MMKIFSAVLLLSLAATATLAADGVSTENATKVVKPEPKTPACGATAEACQVKVDEATNAFASVSRQLQVYRQLLGEANDRVAQAGAAR